MRTSTDRILTTHVGSLIRPPALQDIMRSKQADQSYDRTAYEACLKQSVADVVRRQAEVGLDVISDGEYGKTISWNQYVVERLSGFELRAIPPRFRPGTPGADRTRFKEFYAELDAREPMANPRMVACVGPVKYIGQEIVKRDIDNFKAALAGVKVVEAFMPVVAPSSVLPDRKDEYYTNEEEWLAAVTEAMRTEYRMIVDAGFILQIDDARAATAYDRMVPPATFDDYRRWLARFVESLNHALEGIPEDRVR
jgi:5-methyltetrahydropteroyltriglutamate--homocysteine methyltransferase